MVTLVRRQLLRLCLQYLFGGLFLWTSSEGIAQTPRAYEYDESGNLRIIRPLDVQTDPRNCGAVGKICLPGGQCISGQCIGGSATGAPGPISLQLEDIQCYVFDDAYTNPVGPSDAIYISGESGQQGKACTKGQCRKWFGTCFAVSNRLWVKFYVFDDGYTNVVGPSDAIYIPGEGNKACVPQGNTCRRWFGMGVTGDQRPVTCRVISDFVLPNGSRGMSRESDAIFIPAPIPPAGEACIPTAGPDAWCHRSFGRCTTAALTADRSDGRIFREGTEKFWVIAGGAWLQAPDVATLNRLFPTNPFFQWFGTSPSTYDKNPTDGTLVGEENGKIWIIFGEAKFEIPNSAIRTRLFPGKPILQLWNGVVDGLSTIPKDGTLLREESSTEVFVMKNGQRTTPGFYDPGSVRILWAGALSHIPQAPGPPRIHR